MTIRCSKTTVHDRNDIILFKTTGIEAFILIIPMLVFAVIMGINVFPAAIKKAKSDLKLFKDYFDK